MKRPVLLILLLITITGFSQSHFAIAVGRDSTDHAYSLVQTPDSGFAIVGRSYDPGLSGGDILVTKVNSTLEVEWATVIGGSEYDTGFKIINTLDGGFAAIGKTLSFGSGSYDVILAKLSSSGSIEASRVFGSTGNDEGTSIIQTSYGEFIVTGVIHNISNDDVFVLRLTPMLEVVWQVDIGGSGTDCGLDIIEAADEGFLVTGYTRSFGAGNADLLLIKLSLGGQVQWCNTIGGANDEYGYSVTETSDGQIAVAGYTESFGAGSSDIFVTKLYYGGTITWCKAIGGGSSDIAKSLIETPGRGFALTGYSTSYASGTSDNNGVIVKIDSSGGLDWAKSIGDTAEDYSQSLTRTFDGGYAICGETKSYGINGDYLLAKFDSTGNCCLASEIYPSIANVIPVVTDVTPDTARSFPTLSLPGLTIRGLHVSVTEICTDGIEENSPSAKPEAFTISAYPNPFNGNCRLMIDDLGTGIDAIEIYDVNGRKVEENPPTLRATSLDKGGNGHAPLHKGGQGGSYIWQPAPSLGSGVYLVRATVGEQSTSKRIVYLK